MFMNKVLQYTAVRWALTKANASYDYCKNTSPVFKTSAEKAEVCVTKVAERVSELTLAKSVDERAARALACAEDFVTARRAQLAQLAAEADRRLGAGIDSTLVVAESYVPASARPIVEHSSKLAEAAVECVLPVERERVPLEKKPQGVIPVLSSHIPAVYALRRRTAGKAPMEIASEAYASGWAIAGSAQRVACDQAHVYAQLAKDKVFALVGFALALPLAPVFFALRVLGICKCSPSSAASSSCCRGPCTAAAAASAAGTPSDKEKKSE
eukprot:m51a1_g11584 putative membrane-bound protein (270) ;mRNA; r:58560-60488